MVGLNLKAKRRIGLFGGAFDPPHLAHRRLAQTAVEQFELDELRILPTGDAWHKSRALSDAKHRLAMTRLAFADVPRVVVDAREIARVGPSYTVDTLEALQREQPETDWWLFIGEDQARRFTTWHRWSSILTLAQVVVAARADAAGKDQASTPVHDRQWHNAWPKPASQLAMPPIEISATRIREVISKGQDASAWLTAAVLQYIQQHHLYTASHE